jgi:hypothetical protein
MKSYECASAYIPLHQRFSTWGTIPLGVREKVTGGKQNKNTRKNLTEGMQNKIKQPKETHLGRIFDLGVREGEPTQIWGYAEG